MNQSLIKHHLERLVNFTNTINVPLGYTLLVTGLDIYVLKILANRNIITAIGPQIGIGKEAEVYLAHDSLERAKILKMFRLGRSSFKQIKRNRDINAGVGNWLLLNMKQQKNSIY